MRKYRALVNIGTHPLTKAGDVITDEGVLKRIQMFIRMGQAKAIPQKKREVKSNGK